MRVRQPTRMGIERRELVAPLAVALAIGLRLAIEPIAEGTQVWLTFWPAVFLSAWFGGFRAGLFAIVASVIAVMIWFAGTEYFDGARAVLGALVFALCSTAFCVVVRRHDRLRTIEERTTERHRALIDLAATLAAADSLDDVAHAVVTEGKRASRADTAMLYVLDEATQMLELVAERGCAPEVVAQIRAIAADSEHGKQLLRERWVGAHAEYAAAMPDLVAIRSTHRRAVAWWSLPLVVADRCIGVIAMGFYDPRQFDASEQEFVRMFAGQCAQAVARAERTVHLERTNRRLERIFDSNLIGTVFWASDRQVVRANDTFLRSIGYTHEDFAAGRIDWPALTPPECAALDRDAAETLRATGTHLPYEKEYLHKDGHRVPVLIASAAFFDDPTHGVTFLADLTEVKRAANAANRAKDEFLAMLGHELRNPLAPITTALELLELRGDLERSPRELEIIRRQVAHMIRLVDDLLDVSRIKAGKLQLSQRRVRVAEVIARAVETVAPLIEERRHDLHLDVPDRDVIEADPTRLAQVFTNILINAAKYTDPGGRIEIVARRRDGGLDVEIRDNGVGIDAALLPRVFEQFTQEPQSAARSRGGLGLGLAITQTLVELHGGTVSARSDGHGRGTTICVHLPAVTAASVDGGEAHAVAAAATAPRRVLVVDDNRDAADMLAAVAELRGHTTRYAADAASALRLLEDFRPDVALLDLGLPTIDGFELARRIREHPQHASIRLVAVTGYGQPSDRARTSAAGFDLHLVKPVQVADVLTAIETAAAADPADLA